MINELASVVLTKDIEVHHGNPMKFKYPAGTRGVIVDAHPDGYQVEIFNGLGDTLDVVVVEPEDVEIGRAHV